MQAASHGRPELCDVLNFPQLLSSLLFKLQYPLLFSQEIIHLVLYGCGSEGVRCLLLCKAQLLHSPAWHQAS